VFCYLPEKLFYNTGGPGAIIVFRKNKPAERKAKYCSLMLQTSISSTQQLESLTPYQMKILGV